MIADSFVQAVDPDNNLNNNLSLGISLSRNNNLDLSEE